MSYLYKLESLKLNLRKNNFDDFKNYLTGIINFKYLKNIVKTLPKNLKNLELDLSENSLGSEKELAIFLSEAVL